MRDDRIMDFGRGAGRVAHDRADQWSAEHVVGLVTHLVLLAVFVWAVIKFVNYTVKYLNSRSLDAATPEEIVRKRLASGEITKAEFDQLKKDLK